VALVLPTPVGGAADGWQLVTRTHYPAVSEPAVAGSCIAMFDQLDQDELWLLDRAVISCPAGDDATELRLYDGDPDPARYLSGSDRGTFDEADYPPGLLVEGSRQLVAQWTNVPNGAVGRIRVQVQVYRRRTG
jgi:hypothetical protein